MVARVEPERVQAVLDDGTKPTMAVRLADGSRIRVTPTHPFYADWGPDLRNPGWLEAGQLRAGDRLRTADGRGTTVAGLEYDTGSAHVYTLTVATDHTFFVGAALVLVHNSNACYGTAGEFEDLSGKTFEEANKILEQGTRRVADSAGGYRAYKYPDGSEVIIRDNGEVIRMAAPEYAKTGERTNKGQRLDSQGNLLPRSDPDSHNTGEMVRRDPPPAAE